MLRDSLILLATYNGAKYLPECIESFSKKCDVFASDDCSKDETLFVLNKYKENNNIEIAFGKKHGGASQNFTFLLNNCSLGYKYYFLSDQDDVWTCDKYELLIGEINELEQRYGNDKPILVFGDSIVADQNLSVLYNSFFSYDGIDVNIINSFKSIFFQNVGQGATMVFNNALLRAVRPIPQEIYMHDWWLILFAKTIGIAYLSKYKTLLYRQHDSNCIGAKKRDFSSQVFNQLFGNGKVKSQLLNVKKQISIFSEIYGTSIKDVEVRKFLSQYEKIKNKPALIRKLFLVSNKIVLSNIKRTISLYIYF